MNTKKAFGFFTLLALILLYQSCDPNRFFGLKNNSTSKITVITSNPNSRDTVKDIYTVLPGKYAEFGTTSGMYLMDSSGLMFSRLQIIKNIDTMTINGRTNIYYMFLDNWITINDSTEFHKK